MSNRMSQDPHGLIVHKNHSTQGIIGRILIKRINKIAMTYDLRPECSLYGHRHLDAYLPANSSPYLVQSECTVGILKKAPKINEEFATASVGFDTTTPRLLQTSK